MKLQEYFHHQKHTFLTDHEKFSLYQKVVSKRDLRKSFLQRYAFAKRIAYASFIALFIFSVYGVHIFRDDLRYITNSLIVQRGGDLVQAGYVAQIVQFDGSFVIEHNGKALQTSVIRDGDVVTLRPETQMVFHIDDQTKAQVIGPAQFVITTQEEKDNAYMIQLIHGDFVEIQSLSDQTTQEIALVSSDIVVHQEKRDTASHFQLIREGKNQRIDNKGAQLRIAQESVGDISLASKQTLTLASNDITLLDQETQIARVLVQGDISQTVAFVDVQNDTQTPEDKDLTVDVLSLALDEPSEKVNEELISSVMTTITSSDDRRVITPEQNSELRGALDTVFLNKDMQALFIAYSQGDEISMSRLVASLQNKLINIYKVFSIPAPTTKQETQSFSHTLTMIEELIQGIEHDYYIPPRYVHNLNTLIQRLQTIQKQEFGVASEKTGLREEFNKTIPSNLRFQ